MAHNTSISLGQHFNDFIRRELDGGRFETASEVVRAGLRLLEEDEVKRAALNRALRRGEQGGFERGYSLASTLAKVRRKRR